MCVPTKQYRKYLGCNHTLPSDPCNKYAHYLEMCLAYPTEPLRFDFETMEQLLESRDKFRFCKEGKNIDREFRYGESWQEHDD
jgi:hypothetical protein